VKLAHLFEDSGNFNEREPRWVDDRLIRGGRPLNPSAIEQLKHMGVDTVICFLKPHRVYPAQISGVADERKAVEEAGMKFINIPMEERTGPSDADIQSFLDAVKNGGAVYAHCSAGRDRVGLMTAIYDVEVRHRSYAQAYEDYIRGGHDYHSWPNLDRFFYNWYEKHHGEADPLAVLKKVLPGESEAEALADYVTS